MASRGSKEGTAAGGTVPAAALLATTAPGPEDVPRERLSIASAGPAPGVPPPPPVRRVGGVGAGAGGKPRAVLSSPQDHAA